MALVPAVVPEAVDLIIDFEVSSQDVYERKFARPTWPGGASGVTIGIGYDLGYETVEDLAREWPTLSVGSRARLARACGLKARAAAQALQDSDLGLRNVVVPWEAAYDSFTASTLPRYAAATVRAFPGCEVMPPLAFGALVSLVYNRGGGMRSSDPDRDERREMRAIRDLVAAGKFAAIPDQIRSMKRLWPDCGGLRSRRDREAEFLEKGLTAAAAGARPTA